ncbi:MAG: hypothetical protein NXI01_04895 [Gammaproteobacteria bacterium]|nr:hypothetical protein [Gammaproteobacteria bacterium]
MIEDYFLNNYNSISPQKHPILNFLDTTKNKHFSQIQRTISSLDSSLLSVEDVKTVLDQLINEEARDTANFAEIRRLTYIKQKLAEFKEDDVVCQYILSLISLIQTSQAQTFREFITNDLAQKNAAQALEAYDLLERLFYPNFRGDHKIIIKAAKQQNIKPHTFLPPHLSEHADILEHINSAPNSNYLGALFAYASGFAPSVLGNIVAAHLTSVPSFYRLLISLAPTGLGGIGRLVVAYATACGYGKEVVIALSSGSTLGLITVFLLIQSADLEKADQYSSTYAIILLGGILSSLGISGFSAISLALQSAPDEPFSEYVKRLETMVSAKPTVTDRMLLDTSRTSTKKATSDIAGKGNLAPPATLYAAAGLVPLVGLNGFYGIISTMTFSGILSAYYLLQNSFLDQLRRHNIPEGEAKYLAFHLGQTTFLSGDLSLTFFKKFKGLEHREIIEIGRGVINYMVTFGPLLVVGATGNSTFTQHGTTHTIASLYTGSIIAISSLVRAYISPDKFTSDPINSTNIALLGMIVTTSVIASQPLDSHTLLAIMILFSIFNGLGNRSVFDELGHNIRHKMSEAITLAGGIGALSAFTTGLLFAGVSETNHPNGTVKNGIHQTDTANGYYVLTALSCISLVLNVYYARYLRPQFKPFAATQHHSPEPLPLAEKYRLFSSEPSNALRIVHNKQQERLKNPSKKDLGQFLDLGKKRIDKRACYTERQSLMGSPV